MKKQQDVQSIEMQDLNMESAIESFCRGSGILFVTNQGKLVGAMTEGDINRYFKNGWHSIDKSMINYKISYIVESDNPQKVYADAEKIFEKSSSILNIPVVDEKRSLLYQIDRKDNVMFERIEGYLTLIRENKPMGIFLECYNIEQIVLIGGKPEVLHLVQKFLEEEIAETVEGSNVVVLTVSNVAGCDGFTENTMVICLSDTVCHYLRETFYGKMFLISIKEVHKYYYYTELKRINKGTVKNYLDLFGYDKINVFERNQYIDRILCEISGCGVSVEGESSIPVNDLFNTDIIAYSMNGMYKERITLEKFYVILQTIQAFSQIVGKTITRERCIRECVAFLERYREEGINGVIFNASNLLEHEIFEALKKIKWLRLAKPGEKKDRNIQWLNTADTFRGEYDALLLNMPLLCIQTALTSECYDLLCGYCNKVYIHRISVDKERWNGYIQSNKTVWNYVKNKKDFSSDFTKNMYGKEEFPVEKLWSNILGCKRLYINEGYNKYQSNYVSEFFNTDTYGRRITTNMPQKYHGTIWLLGNCLYAGYAVGDTDTIASILQNRLNQLGKNYRVISLGMHGAYFWSQINRVCETGIGKDDIVVCWVDSMWNRADGEYVITTDSNKFSKQISRDEYWDFPLHCGVKGYSIIAEQILEKIEPDLIQIPNRKFYLEPDLEAEVNLFLDDIIERLKKNPVYNAWDGISSKFGAVVMNCNPFTYGHLYLIETASRLVDLLYLFVVEEDKSVFSFEDRMHMVQEGVKDIPNVVVLPSGKFMISSVTFSGYFTKESPTSECYDSFLDLKIFANYIAPALEISMRFVGEEPFDKVTAQYNCDMKVILNEQSINVIEIPRKMLGNKVISATQVRSLMVSGNYELLKDYVPGSTYEYLQQRYF